MGAYETKVILKMTAKIIAQSKSLESAYNAVAESAKDEGITLPTFEEASKDAKE